MKDIPVEDVGDKLIIPGLTDLHVHAPQYSFRGLGMDMELLDWLETNTFPEEAKYKDLEYAKKAYGIFAEQMRKSAATKRVFCNDHKEATILLMDLMEKRAFHYDRKGKYGPQQPGLSAGAVSRRIRRSHQRVAENGS